MGSGVKRHTQEIVGTLTVDKIESPEDDMLQISVVAAMAHSYGAGTSNALGGFNATGASMKFGIALPTYLFSSEMEIDSVVIGFETGFNNDFISHTYVSIYDIDQTNGVTLVDDPTDRGNGSTGKVTYTVTPTVSRSVHQKYVLISLSMSIGTSDVEVTSFRVILKNR